MDRRSEGVGVDVEAFCAGRRRWSLGLLRWWMGHSFGAAVINRKRGRTAVNRSQAGIRSRRRRLGVVVPTRASALPLHEGSAEAQSEKTGCDPTAAHGLSALAF